jgi:hypothetical protein
MPIRRPCIECRRLTTETTRCPTCQGKREAIRNASRPHYKGDYPERARLVRETATHCHICGEGPREGDPWTADHVFGPDSDVLAAAHRSCNSSRGAREQRP